MGVVRTVFPRVDLTLSAELAPLYPIFFPVSKYLSIFIPQIIGLQAAAMSRIS